MQRAASGRTGRWYVVCILLADGLRCSACVCIDWLHAAAVLRALVRLQASRPVVLPGRQPAQLCGCVVMLCCCRVGLLCVRLLLFVVGSAPLNAAMRATECRSRQSSLRTADLRAAAPDVQCEHADNANYEQRAATPERDTGAGNTAVNTHKSITRLAQTDIAAASLPHTVMRRQCVKPVAHAACCGVSCSGRSVKCMVSVRYRYSATHFGFRPAQQRKAVRGSAQPAGREVTCQPSHSASDVVVIRCSSS